MSNLAQASVAIFPELAGNSPGKLSTRIKGDIDVLRDIPFWQNIIEDSEKKGHTEFGLCWLFSFGEGIARLLKEPSREVLHQLGSDIADIVENMKIGVADPALKPLEQMKVSIIEENGGGLRNELFITDPHGMEQVLNYVFSRSFPSIRAAIPVVHGVSETIQCLRDNFCDGRVAVLGLQTKKYDASHQLINETGHTVLVFGIDVAADYIGASTSDPNDKGFSYVGRQGFEALSKEAPIVQTFVNKEGNMSYKKIMIQEDNPIIWLSIEDS